MRISDWSSDVCSSDLLLCPIRFERLLNDNVIRRSVFTAHINHDRHRECGVEEDDASPAAHPSRRCDPPARASIGQGNSGGVLCPPYTRNASCSQCIRSRSEEHTSELQSLMRISYAVFCLKKKTNK